MNQLKFSENPNGKLFCDCFGDIRLADYEKFQHGRELECMLRKHEMGVITVIGWKDFPLRSLNDTTSFINSGLPANKQARLLRLYYPTLDIKEETLFMYIVFQYRYRNVAEQSALLKEWWSHKEQKFPIYNTNQENLHS